MKLYEDNYLEISAEPTPRKGFLPARMFFWERAYWQDVEKAALAEAAQYAAHPPHAKPHGASHGAPHEAPYAAQPPHGKPHGAPHAAPYAAHPPHAAPHGAPYPAPHAPYHGHQQKKAKK